jgi:putative nucleotidyltransferase with HDIG domain
MTDLKKIVKGIENLEPIPQAATKIMSIVEDPDSSISDVTKLVEYEPALTANLLKICNSAYFGLSREITSVHHAVSLLGMAQVADLVLMASAAKNLKKGQEGYDLRDGELWKYSVASALIARELAGKKGAENNNLIFTAALLKDIGKIVLSQYVNGAFDEINALVSKHAYSFNEAEKEVFGIDHAELGGMVAERWKFNDTLADVIRNHHMSDESSVSDFETGIIYIADMLCMMMGIGGGSDGLAYRFHGETTERLGFSQMDFQMVMADFGEKLREVEDLFSLT